MPEGGGEPVQADNILCHLGAEETLESFTENLRGANRRAKQSSSESKYPDDYPDQKLAGKTYDYTVEVQGIKEKKLPELNDEFAKDAAGEGGGVSTLAELRKKIRENLEAAKEQQQAIAGAREDSRDAREAARLPRSRSAGRKPDGCAPGARGALAGRAGRRSARGECGLGVRCAGTSATAP